MTTQASQEKEFRRVLSPQANLENKGEGFHSLLMQAAITWTPDPMIPESHNNPRQVVIEQASMPEGRSIPGAMSFMGSHRSSRDDIKRSARLAEAQGKRFCSVDMLAKIPNEGYPEQRYTWEDLEALESPGYAHLQSAYKSFYDRAYEWWREQMTEAEREWVEGKWKDPCTYGRFLTVCPQYLGAFRETFFPNIDIFRLPVWVSKGQVFTRTVLFNPDLIVDYNSPSCYTAEPVFEWNPS